MQGPADLTTTLLCSSRTSSRSCGRAGQSGRPNQPVTGVVTTSLATVAVIVVGHGLSEEAGMAALADWLRQRLPGLPITHVPAGDPIDII